MKNKIKDIPEDANSEELFRGIDWEKLSKMREEMEKSIRNSIIIDMQVTEDEIQSLAEPNYGRELTDIELNRIKEGWFDSEEVSWRRYELIFAAIEDALDNTDNQWKSTDDDYRKIRLFSKALSRLKYYDDPGTTQ